MLRGNCCASCHYKDSGVKCGGTRTEDPSRAADAETIRDAKLAAARRRKNNAARWKREHGGKAPPTKITNPNPGTGRPNPGTGKPPQGGKTVFKKAEIKDMLVKSAKLVNKALRKAGVDMNKPWD
jgi:hypothetical protein